MTCLRSFLGLTLSVLLAGSDATVVSPTAYDKDCVTQGTHKLMWSDWLLPEVEVCTDVTMHLNYSGTFKQMTTKGKVECKNGYVQSFIYWKLTPQGPAGATDCSDTLLGWNKASFAEYADLWSGDCMTAQHFNAYRGISGVEYHKMYVTPELQALAPSCIKGLLRPVGGGTATPVPATFTSTPVAKFASEKKQDDEMKTSSFMQSLGSGPVLGLFGLLLASVVVGVRMRMRRVRSPADSMEEISDGETSFVKMRVLQRNSTEVQALSTEDADVENSLE